MGGRTRWNGRTILGITSLLQVTIMVVACGGTVRKDDDGPDPDGDDPDAVQTGNAGAAGGGGGKAPGSGGPEVDLPECRLGVKQSAAERCIFLYEGRCYEDKLDACGCACKKQRGTVCSSGFPRDDEPTQVTCS